MTSADTHVKQNVSIAGILRKKRGSCPFPVESWPKPNTVFAVPDAKRLNKMLFAIFNDDELTRPARVLASANLHQSETEADTEDEGGDDRDEEEEEDDAFMESKPKRRRCSMEARLVLQDCNATAGKKKQEAEEKVVSSSK